MGYERYVHRRLRRCSSDNCCSLHAWTRLTHWTVTPCVGRQTLAAGEWREDQGKPKRGDHRSRSLSRRVRAVVMVAVAYRSLLLGHWRTKSDWRSKRSWYSVSLLSSQTEHDSRRRGLLVRAIMVTRKVVCWSMRKSNGCCHRRYSLLG